MAIAREVWLNMVEDNLYTPDLESVKSAIKDDSAFVYNGGGATVVHIPNAGTAAAVTKGNDTYPVAAAKRTDVDNYYSLTNYEVGPILINNKDAKLNSYEQQESILTDQLQGLGARVAREILIGQYHYTSTLYVNTTGSAVAASTHAPGATGNRKLLLAADLRTALGILDKNRVPNTDRYLFVDSTMYWELMTDLGFTAYRDQVTGTNQDGRADNLFGVKIIMLPQVVFATSAGLVRAADNTTGATTDVAVALLVQKNCTSMAMTEIIATTSSDSPGYFGDTYEASVLGGGKYRRYDKMGVVPIVGIS